MNRNDTRQILYQQEVLGYLRDFVYPRSKAPRHTPPETMPQVIEDIDATWGELDQFLSPLGLRKSLLADYLNDEREGDIIQIVDTLGKMRYDNRDPMTQYMRKTELGIITGLSHLYSIITDEPCAIIELDYSNMGGTNKFFQTLLADAKGVPFEDIDEKEAQTLTDTAARVIAQIVVQEVSRIKNNHSVILPIRAGGDELRIICTDLDPKHYANLKQRIHQEIEFSVARMGLLDHAHLKHPDNPLKLGFGAAIAISDLREVKPDTYRETADAQIAVSKSILGHIRNGKTPPDDLSASTAFNHDYADPKTVKFRHIALREAQKIAKTGQAEEISTAQRLMNIKREMAQLLWHTDYEDQSTYDRGLFEDDVSPFDMSGDDYNPKLLYMSVAEEYEWKLAQHMTAQGVEPDDYEMAMLYASLPGLTPIDPATDTLMPRDMPHQLEIYIRDLKAHLPYLQDQLNDEGQNSATIKAGPLHTAMARAHMLPEDLPNLSPMMMGVSFHNLAGLNALFGHDNADKVLKYMAQDILVQTFRDHGFNEDDYAVAHEGGGNFTLLFKPVMYDHDGSMKIIGHPQIDAITKDIEHQIQRMNNDSIASMAASLEMRFADPDQLKQFHLQGIEEVSQIPDQKQRPWMDGLHVSIASRPFDITAWDNGQKRMGLHLHHLRRSLEDKVEHDRELGKALYDHQLKGRPSRHQPKR